MAAGEAARVSVHEANRLGCNSPLDIVVLGRPAALRCAEKLTAKATQPELPPDAGEGTLARIDRLRNAKGATPTAVLGCKCSARCKATRPCLGLEVFCEKAKKLYARSGTVCPTSPCRNSDLVETLEFENLRLQATALVDTAIARTESRGAHAREDFPKRDDQNWMKHTLAWVDPNGAVRSDYRPVHTYTLSKDIQYIEPTARVY
jgi:succinate dehydrogenase / fumarate reductase flavoprotein subunit